MGVAVGVVGEEVGGVGILRTYAAGTNPCFPSFSTFHQSYYNHIIVALHHYDII